MSLVSVIVSPRIPLSIIGKRSIWSTELFGSNSNSNSNSNSSNRSNRSNDTDYNDDESSSKSNHVTRDMTYTLCKTINGVPPERTFNVVSQIHRYEDYIPYCKESVVNERDIRTKWPSMASLRIGFRQYDETFICKVTCHKKHTDHYMIIADSISNHLFNGFKCQWDIMAHPNRPESTQIKLSLQFQFKSALYNGVASLFARGLTSLALNSFHKRIIQCERGEVKQ